MTLAWPFNMAHGGREIVWGHYPIKYRAYVEQYNKGSLMINRNKQEPSVELMKHEQHKNDTSS